MRRLPLIRPGYTLFLADGAESFGGVRQVIPGGKPELLVNVEGGGDFRLPLDAIDHVHEDKVVVRWDQLEEQVQEAIKHALDAEDFPPEGEDEVEIVPPFGDDEAEPPEA